MEDRSDDNTSKLINERNSSDDNDKIRNWLTGIVELPFTNVFVVVYSNNNIVVWSSIFNTIKDIIK